MKERPILFSGPMVRAILEGRKTQTRRVMKPAPLPARDSDGQEWWLVDFESEDRGYGWKVGESPFWTHCPYGIPGDRLWVRETWGIADSGGRLLDPCLNYRADGTQKPLHDRLDIGWSPNPVCGVGASNEELLKIRDGWRPCIFMPRWASRITLEITDVRVQRVQEISEEDAQAEGAEVFDGLECECGWRGYEASQGVVEAGPEEDSHFLCPLCTEVTAHFPIDEQGRQGFRLLWDSINAKRGFGWDVNPWVWALTFRRIDA